MHVHKNKMFCGHARHTCTCTRNDHGMYSYSETSNNGLSEGGQPLHGGQNPCP